MIPTKTGFLIFGGMYPRSRQVINRILSYDQKTNKITKIKPNENSPQPAPRKSHSAVLYKDYMIIYGGDDGINVFDDCWAYSLINNIWIKLNLTGEMASIPRTMHKAIIIQRYMFLIGGINNTNDDIPIVVVNLVTLNTESINIEGNFIKGFSRFACQYVESTKEIICYGGYDKNHEIQINSFFILKIPSKFCNPSESPPQGKVEFKQSEALSRNVTTNINESKTILTKIALYSSENDEKTTKKSILKKAKSFNLKQDNSAHTKPKLFPISNAQIDDSAISDDNNLTQSETNIQIKSQNNPNITHSSPNLQIKANKKEIRSENIAYAALNVHLKPIDKKKKQKKQDLHKVNLKPTTNASTLPPKVILNKNVSQSFKDKLSVYNKK